MTAIIILALLAALGYVAFHISRQPDVFRVERSININAPADSIFPWMNNPKRAAEWSPWVQMDPTGDYRYEGPEAGVGAITVWSGKKSGAGKLTVTDEIQGQRVTMCLDFIRPMKCTNTVEYTLTPTSDGTNVSWVMFGPNNVIGKAMSLFMNCDKICGDQFEIGLRNLKKKVEG